ncbi:hypothetical protein GALMADRAFT_260082 [Galerina marginata CBS 339.88]|uniref:TFIIS N-terminal domain-containing protein n=1 Tax=Galerina marginata (strain CBS 339.88) TaxID=685588 RepID=A0A067SGK3_GALM3|nr:hypothetical protein GALMADRAFT_260082 [Galerina marginata CBS 339.88]
MSQEYSDEKLSVIRSAPEDALLSSRNPVYLELFKENEGLNATLSEIRELLSRHANFPAHPPDNLSLETVKKLTASVTMEPRIEPSDRQSQKIKDWRHTLQKTFLNSKAPAKAEDMPKMDRLFAMIEACNEMTVEQLDYSKIGKVMRHISVLEGHNIPPRDDEFKFRARAKVLFEKWLELVSGHHDRPTGTDANVKGNITIAGDTTNANLGSSIATQDCEPEAV